MAYTKVTPEKLAKCKEYLTNAQYAGLTQNEISVLVGVSLATVRKIKYGDYDELSPSTKKTDKTDGIKTIIPYEELSLLMECRGAILDLLNSSILSDRVEDSLYIPTGAFNGIMKRRFGPEVKNRIEQLKSEVDDNE